MLTQNIPRPFKHTKYQGQLRAGCDVRTEAERNSTVPMNQHPLHPAEQKRHSMRVKHVLVYLAILEMINNHV